MARRKAHAEEHVNHERWLLTYADLITLLMVFFVVMYSMGKADVAKFARLQASFARAFNVQVLRGSIPTSMHGEDGTASPTSVINAENAQFSVASQDHALVTVMNEVRQGLASLPKTERMDGNVKVGLARDGVVISLSGNVLFDSGQADLRADGLPILDEVAWRLAPVKNELRIEGHTDNIPIATPLYSSNWELSAARATTVARYLAEHGVDPSRLIAAGYGEYRPVASNHTREGRASNRRVDIVVIAGQPAPGRSDQVGVRP